MARGVEWHRSARESRRWRERLEAELQSRHTRLARAIGGLQLTSDRMLDAMLSILTQSDRDAYLHARDVSALATTIAERMGLPPQQVAVIRRAALLHDIGKLAMPEAILRKPAPLGADEQGIVRQYPALGADLIAAVPFLTEAADIVRHTQERPDGRGYPGGLRADAISMGARIVAAADAYLTMTSRRVFRDALGPAEAMRELERCSGTQFDTRVVAVLKQAIAPVH